ncbi:hypothetical protein FN846DRAFT_920074 [Sphaerosporella brunnea]|uniref:Major facilitator superfamily domain-containing protein n=1 Tax=Sphaerosporella brunnea TaxID=1250544 RepID=A0A5J5ETR3_9PEZI|nr:hypothetical protein FN846DRAFT_920074 [Sphaerosporella brunnea]
MSTNPPPAAAVELLAVGTDTSISSTVAAALPQSSYPAAGQVAASERRLVRKLDFLILPLLAPNFFLAQIGRGNAVSAMTAGMGLDLSFDFSTLKTIMSVFMCGYIWATTLLRHFTAPAQLGIAMIFWGTMAVCRVFAENRVAIGMLRFFVGRGQAFTQGAML